jgi:hypothetical protein
MKALPITALVMALGTSGVASADRFGGHGGGHVAVHESFHGGGGFHGGYEHGGFRGGYEHGGFRGGYEHGGFRGGYVEHGGFRGGYERGYVGRGWGGGWGHGPVVRGGWGWGYRAPIYVDRPIIHEHYYDYRYRPELIVEDYPVRDGYVWVRGHWDWNGVEWIWTPGYYEPVY